ncbi:MAG: phenylalanine--tRNA ligase subunit alpha, partial [candidate division Zixibacteria bacterium]|nr:phenylalanine--tRNA ligase subunit alpha [candidate division Zixibacteria bacterium]
MNVDWTAVLALALTDAKAEIAQCNSADQIESLRVKYLGRKSNLTTLLRTLKDYDGEQRKGYGQQANETKKQIEELLASQSLALGGAKSHRHSGLDYTLPGKRYPTGKLHPITRTLNEIIDIFYGMGFEVALGPEVETEYYNFGALNFPPDH